MKTRHTIAASLFLVGLVINPAYFAGCAGYGVEDEKKYEFDYGEEEMLAVLEDINAVRSWSITSGGIAYTVELSLEQMVGEDMLAGRHGASAWAQTAHACGYHEQMFAATASACITTYRSVMPIEGSLKISITEGDEAVLIEEVDVTGEFAINGHTFEQSWAEIRIAESQGVVLVLEGETPVAIQRGRLEAKDIGQDSLDIMGELLADGT